MSAPDINPLIEHTSPIDINSRVVKREASGKVIDRVLQPYSGASSILEVGSGTGELYRMLPGSYKEGYVGLDNNPYYLSFNRAADPTVTLEEGDVCELPFPDDSYDVVLGLNVLDVIHNAAGALHEIHRVLQPGGHFIHFHDRRPNLGFLASNLPDDEIAFPRLNRYGAFDRFRLVPQTTLEALPPEQKGNLDGYAYLARNDFDAIERSIAFMPAVLTILADRVDEYFGRLSTKSDAVTAPFKPLFTGIVTRMIEQEGLQIVIAKDLPSEAIVPTDAVQSLAAHRYLDFPYSEGNTFIIDANGYYHFGRLKNHELPIGHTLLKTFLNTIVAMKPHDKGVNREA